MSIFLLAALSLSSGGPIESGPALTLDAQEQTGAERVRDFLLDEGFRPEIDEAGDVTFRFEGRFYYVSIYEDDPGFFHLVFPNFWEIEDKEERIRALEAANQVNRDTKTIKIYINAFDNVSCSVECFMAKPDDFEAYFFRSLQVMQDSVRNFVERMNE